MRKIKRRKKLPHWILRIRKLVHKPEVRDWCKLPYRNHKYGCPNYGKKKECPPQSKYITDLVDINKPMYLVFSEFNLEKHIEKMRKRHPHWTEYQLRNVLYWQPTSKKQMKERSAKARWIIGTEVALYLPESHGVHVYATAFHSGLKLEKIKDIKTNRHIALLGYKRK